MLHAHTPRASVVVLSLSLPELGRRPFIWRVDMNHRLSPATEPRNPDPLACSRCGRLMPDGDSERDEALVVSFRAGFWSIFGDESHVEGIFCQHCLKASLGPWLRVTEGRLGDGWHEHPSARGRQLHQLPHD